MEESRRPWMSITAWCCYTACHCRTNTDVWGRKINNQSTKSTERFNLSLNLIMYSVLQYQHWKQEKKIKVLKVLEFIWPWKCIIVPWCYTKLHCSTNQKDGRKSKYWKYRSMFDKMCILNVVIQHFIAEPALKSEEEFHKSTKRTD